jgi:hypothetical protein
MGKTTLAVAALHHPIVVEKYAHRHFISCESANSCADLVTTMGLHLGLELSRQLSKTIVQYLGQSASCLVVLDNFETPWEPMESRGQVEEFLSLLADIPSLALMVRLMLAYLCLLMLFIMFAGYNAGSRKAGQNEMDSAIPPSSGATVSFSLTPNIH